MVKYKALTDISGDVRNIKAGWVFTLSKVLVKEGDISLKVWAILERDNECLTWRVPFAVLQECFEKH